MDYTTFSYVRANNLFTFFVASEAAAKREGEGKGEGEKGKYRGKDQGPCLFPFLPIPFTFQLLLRRLFFLFFFFAKGRATRVDGENNIIIKWIRSLKKAMYMYSNATT